MPGGGGGGVGVGVGGGGTNWPQESYFEPNLSV